MQGVGVNQMFFSKRFYLKIKISTAANLIDNIVSVFFMISKNQTIYKKIFLSDTSSLTERMSLENKSNLLLVLKLSNRLRAFNKCGVYINCFNDDKDNE